MGGALGSAASGLGANTYPVLFGGAQQAAPFRGGDPYRLFNQTPAASGTSWSDPYSSLWNRTGSPAAVSDAGSGWSPFGSTGPTIYRTGAGEYLQSPYGSQVSSATLSGLPDLPGQARWGSYSPEYGRPGYVDFGGGLMMGYNPITQLYDQAPQNLNTAAGVTTGAPTTDQTNTWSQYQGWVNQNRPFVPGVTVTAPPSGFFGSSNTGTGAGASTGWSPTALYLLNQYLGALGSGGGGGTGLGQGNMWGGGSMYPGYTGLGGYGMGGGSGYGQAGGNVPYFGSSTRGGGGYAQPPFTGYGSGGWY